MAGHGFHIMVSHVSIALLSMLSSCSDGGDAPVASPLQGEGEQSSMDANQSEAVAGNNGPAGESALLLDSTRYPLDAAIGDIWGTNDSHFQIDFTLTDGNFMIESIDRNGQSYEVLVPAEARAIVRADVYSPGASFDFGSFTFMAGDNIASAPAGAAYFTQAYVGVDSNDDSRVGDEERFDVIDGVIEFEGAVPYIVLRFSMTLSNGKNVTGEYTGLFDFNER